MVRKLFTNQCFEPINKLKKALLFRFRASGEGASYHSPRRKMARAAVITVEPTVKYFFVFKKYANELGSSSAVLSSPVVVLAHLTEQRLVI